MPNYTHISGSKFPEQIITLTNYLDATDDISSYINEIKSMQISGEYNLIKKYLDEHQELKRYILGAEAINKIEEETRNVEIYAKNSQQQIYYQTSYPYDVASVYDIWIGENLDE